MNRRPHSYLLLLALGLLLSLGACGGGGGSSAASTSVPTPAPPASTPASVQTLSAMAALGERAFNDRTLSGSGRMTCATCHDPDFAHGSPNALAVQIGGQFESEFGQRSAPSIRYLERQPAFDPVGITGGLTADGRADSLAAQSHLVLFNPLEFDNTSVERLAQRVRAAVIAADFAKDFGTDGDDATAVAQLEQAVAATDDAALRDLAHKIAGSAGMMQNAALSRAARQMEMALREGRGDAAREAWPEVQACVMRTLGALELAFTPSLVSRCDAIACSGSTSSAAPALIASRGMPNTTHDASSCTRFQAPASRISRMARAPSAPMPVSMMPMARLPAWRATDWNSTSTDGFHPGDNFEDLSRQGYLSAFATRPVDMKRLTDYMLGAWPQRAQLDAGKVGFFGFSRGGYTGLVAIGAVPDWASRQDLCSPLSTRPLCGEIRRKEIPATPAPDRRIRAA
eukprot:gene42872-53194_t